MLNVNKFAAESRELVVAFHVRPAEDAPGAPAVVTRRLYPPPNVDWKLVGARYEVGVDLAGAETIDILDAADNALVTQLAFGASVPAGTRGSFVLTGTEAQLCACSSLGGYHKLVSTLDGSTAGILYLWLYYRKVQASGRVTLARQA